MELLFNVINQHIQTAAPKYVVSDSINYLEARFFFSDDWDGFEKTAVFTGADSAYTALLNDGGCIVPHEIITAGRFSVSVFGIRDDVRITTDTVYITVQRSGFRDGETPKPPTPTVYEQILGRIAGADSAIADEAKQRTAADDEILQRVTAADSAIAAEAQQRATADDEILQRVTAADSAIAAEAQQRENADDEILQRVTAADNAIAAEAQQRENADNEILQKLAEETAERKTAVDDLKSDIDVLTIGNKALLDYCIKIPNKSIGIVNGSFNMVDSDTTYLLAIPISLLKQEGVLMIGATNFKSNRYLVLNKDFKRVSKNFTAEMPYVGHLFTWSNDAVYWCWSFANDVIPDLSAVAGIEFGEYINHNLLKGYKYEEGLNLIKDWGYSHGYFSSISYDWNKSRISTNLIKLEAGETISFSKDILNPMYIIVIDSNYKYLSRNNISFSKDYAATWTNNTDDYVWIYITDSNTNNAVFNLKAVRGRHTIYEIAKMCDLNDHISKDVIPNDLTGKNTSSWNEITRYYGKHYSAIGDSLTAIGSGGLYLDYIDSVLFTTHTNTGMGGTRITGSNNDAMWQDMRMEKLNIDSDFITIMGGTNDVGKNLTVSDSDFTLSNHDTNNFVGAYNLMLSKIYYKFMKRTSGYYSDIDYSGLTQVETAKDNFFILIITPPKNLGSVDKYNEIILFDQYVTRIADMWGIPVVHAGEEMGMSWMTYEEEATDMVHFSRKWHNRLGQLCVSKLREIEPIN